MEIKYRKGTENPIADHLSRLEPSSHGVMEEDDIIIEHFSDEQVLAVHAMDYINVST